MDAQYFTDLANKSLGELGDTKCRLPEAVHITKQAFSEAMLYWQEQLTEKDALIESLRSHIAQIESAKEPSLWGRILNNR